MEQELGKLALKSNPGLDDARFFVQQLVRLIGPGFHLDTKFEEYVCENGENVFGLENAQALNLDLIKAMDVFDKNGADGYSIGLDEQRKVLYGEA